MGLAGNWGAIWGVSSYEKIHSSKERGKGKKTKGVN